MLRDIISLTTHRQTGTSQVEAQSLCASVCGLQLGACKLALNKRLTCMSLPCYESTRQRYLCKQAGRKVAHRRVGSKKDSQRWLFYQLKSVRVTDGAGVSTCARAQPSLSPRWHHWSWQERAHRKLRGRWGPVCLSYLWEAHVLTPCQQTLTGWSSRKYWWETYYEMRERLPVKWALLKTVRPTQKYHATQNPYS